MSKPSKPKKRKRWTVCRGCLNRMDAERRCIVYEFESPFMGKKKFQAIRVERVRR